MNDRFPQPEADDDEPVIGLDFPLYDDPAYDSDEEDGAGAPTPYVTSAPPSPPVPRGFSYDGGGHANHPAFLVFVALAVVVGAGAIFTLYSFIRSTEDDPGPAPTPIVVTTPGFRASILSPRNGTRLDAGKVQDFAVEVASPAQAVTRYALFVNNEVVAVLDDVPPPAGTTYSAQLPYEFLHRGEYSIFVRVSTADGAFHDSEPISVIAQEAPGEAPKGIAGRVVARSNIVAGPGPQFSVLGSVNPDQQVTVFGRSRDGEWLLIDDASDRWIRRAAVQESDSLSLVPVREARATPAPTRPVTVTPSPSSSATVSPTPSVDGPDLVPTDARFVIDGSRRILRVTLSNEGKPYAGPLVIGVTTSPGGLVPGQSVLDATIGTNETITLDLDVSGTPPERTDVIVRADPGNLIQERSEDNNTVTFKSVPPPADPPVIAIGAVSTQGNVVTVVVRNTGGALLMSTVQVSIQGVTTTTTAEREVALDKGATVSFQVPSPGAGPATIVVKVNGVAVASGPAEIS